MTPSIDEFDYAMSEGKFIEARSLFLQAVGENVSISIRTRVFQLAVIILAILGVFHAVSLLLPAVRP